LGWMGQGGKGRDKGWEGRGNVRQDICVLVAVAAVVVGSAGVELGLGGGEAGVEDATQSMHG